MATNLEFIKSASGTSVSFLDVTDCFSADYDVYYFSLTKVKRAGGIDAFVVIRYLDSGGTVIDQTEYDYAGLETRAYVGFGANGVTNASEIKEIAYGSSNATDIGGISLYVYNPYDSSSYTFLTSQSSSVRAGYGNWGSKVIAVHKSAEQLSGVRFIAEATTYDNITVNVYGVK